MSAAAETATAACREVREAFSRYLDGALPPGREEAFRAHLRDCPSCAGVLRSDEEEKHLLEDALGGFRPGRSSILRVVRDIPSRISSPRSLPWMVYLPLIVGAAVFVSVTSYHLLPEALMTRESRIPLASLLLLNMGSAVLACGLILGAGRLVEFDSSSITGFFRKIARSRGAIWGVEAFFGLLLVFVLFWLFAPAMGGLALLGERLSSLPAGLVAGMLGTVLLGGFTFAVLASLAREPGRSVRAEIVVLQTAGLVVLLAACASHYYVLARWVETSGGWVGA